MGILIRQKTSNVALFAIDSKRWGEEEMLIDFVKYRATTSPRDRFYDPASKLWRIVLPSDTIADWDRLVGGFALDSIVSHAGCGLTAYDPVADTMRFIQRGDVFGPVKPTDPLRELLHKFSDTNPSVKVSSGMGFNQGDPFKSLFASQFFMGLAYGGHALEMKCSQAPSKQFDPADMPPPAPTPVAPMQMDAYDNLVSAFGRPEERTLIISNISTALPMLGDIRTFVADGAKGTMGAYALLDCHKRIESEREHSRLVESAKEREAYGGTLDMTDPFWTLGLIKPGCSKEDGKKIRANVTDDMVKTAWRDQVKRYRRALVPGPQDRVVRNAEAIRNAIDNARDALKTAEARKALAGVAKFAEQFGGALAPVGKDIVPDVAPAAQQDSGSSRINYRSTFSITCMCREYRNKAGALFLLVEQVMDFIDLRAQ